MVKEPKEKTFADFHEEIEALKIERGEAWKAQLPDHINDHAADDEVGIKRSIQAAAIAEVHPDVIAIEAKIRLLRMEQLAQHDEPEYVDHNANVGK